MLAKLKALAARTSAALKAAKQTATTVAGFAAQLLALGVLHGTALTVAQGILALATILGVHVAAKAAAKAAAQAAISAHTRPQLKPGAYTAQAIVDHLRALS